MAERISSLARINFSPDQLDHPGSESVSADFIRFLQTEGAGRYLSGLHQERADDPIHLQIASVRQVFDAAYRNDPSNERTGEAFEDGALIASLIAELHYKELMPALAADIESTLKDYKRYYGNFSDRQIDFIKAIRDDSGRNYMRFAKVIFPIINYVSDDKYGDTASLPSMAEGASFILDRLKAAHRTDYEAFRLDVELMDLTYPNELERQRILGIEAVKLFDDSKILY